MVLEIWAADDIRWADGPADFPGRLVVRHHDAIDVVIARWDRAQAIEQESARIRGLFCIVLAVVLFGLVAATFVRKEEDSSNVANTARNVEVAERGESQHRAQAVIHDAQSGVAR